MIGQRRSNRDPFTRLDPLREVAADGNAIQRPTGLSNEVTAAHDLSAYGAMEVLFSLTHHTLRWLWRPRLIISREGTYKVLFSCSDTCPVTRRPGMGYNEMDTTNSPGISARTDQ